MTKEWGKRKGKDELAPGEEKNAERSNPRSGYNADKVGPVV